MDYSENIPGKYTVDPNHSTIGFWARHAMVTKVRGNFTNFEAFGEIAEANDKSKVRVTIKTNSITTGNNDRDNHLKSPDFFNVEKNPEITFYSEDITIQDDRVLLNGALNLNGASKNLNLILDLSGTSKDPFGITRVGLEGTFIIKRSDFGLTWNAALETGGVLVSDEIHVNLELSVIKNYILYL